MGKIKITKREKQHRFILGLLQFLGITLWIPLAQICQRFVLGETEYSPNVEYAWILAFLGLIILVVVLLGIKDDD